MNMGIQPNLDYARPILDPARDIRTRLKHLIAARVRALPASRLD